MKPVRSCHCSICLPRSASSAMIRSSSQAATVLRLKRQAFMNAWFRVASSAVLACTASRSPSAASTGRVRGSTPRLSRRLSIAAAPASMTRSHIEGSIRAPASISNSVHCGLKYVFSLSGSDTSIAYATVACRRTKQPSSWRHESNAGYSVISRFRRSTSFSWMAFPASTRAHSTPLPRRLSTSAARSCQLANPYSRASTSCASRWDSGNSALGNCARARAIAAALPAEISRASFLPCLRRDSCDGRAGRDFDRVMATSFHECL